MNTVRYLDAVGAWLVTAPQAAGIEILVTGSPQAADPQRLALIQDVLENLPDVTKRAISHLDEFVDREAFAKGNDWFLEGLSSLAPGDAETEFKLEFSIEEDLYGSWSVSFQRSLGRYWAVGFSRRNV